jgi:DNA invertase Pin-like site-specific DNA recombinase
MNNKTNKQKLTICYSRLSRDDEREGISGSITNQQDILQKYAEQNGLTPYKHIFDDGQSGTSFTRPGWVEVMSEVEAGNVGTTLLKTMDRMGRDYLRVGLLLEQFRELGVRIIAVSEGVDTANGEDDFLPLRNLFAEWYARDCSKKIRAVFQSRMSNSKRCSGAIPYGFVTNNGDVNDLLIDEEAAVIVRRIFNMIIEGKGVNDIARMLMNEQVPIPSEHWKRTGRPSHSKKYDDPYGWTATTVGYIIANPAYKGTIVLGKTQNTSYKGHKAVKTAIEQQYIFENALPPIVDCETWENAQRLKKTVRRTPKIEKEPNPLTGLLYCAECGAKLTHRHTHNKKGWLDDSYICSAYRKGIKQLCTMHYISVKNIEKLILAAIRRVSCYDRDNNGDFIEKVRAASVVQAEKSVRDSKTKLAKSTRRVAELDTLISKLYQDNASGKIPDKHYERMFAEYDGEQTELETQITELQTEIDTFAADSVRADKFIDLALRYTEFEELTPVLLNEFIDRVVIHEKDKSGGKTTQEVDIYFNFIGGFVVPDDYDEYPPEIRAAMTAESERLDKKNAYEKERRRKQYWSDRYKQNRDKKKAECEISVISASA